MKTKKLLLALAVTVGMLASSARADIASDYAELTAGLTVLSPGGSPGRVVPYGLLSFPLFSANSNGAPAVAAAGHWNDDTNSGRGVAYGHTAWTATNDSLGLALSNALRWVAKGKTNAVIGIGPSTVSTAFLTNLGYTVKSITATMTTPANDLSGVDVFLASMHSSYSTGAVSQTTNHLANGGGMLMFATSWSLNNAQLTSANTILAGLGLFYTKTTLSPGTYPVPAQPFPVFASALAAAHLLIDHGNGVTNLSLAVEHAAADVVESLLLSQPLFPPLVPALETLTGVYGLINVTAANHLIRDNKPTEAMLARFQSQQFDELTPGELFVHPSASDFPGLPLAGSTVVRTVNINGNTPTNFYINHGEKPTRTELPLYAKPGEAFTITIPTNLVNSGLRLQIGAHSDLLFDLSNCPRFPKIARWQDLTNAVTEVGNVFGGALILLVPPASSFGQFSITLSNVLEMPAFILGQTTDEAWTNSVRNAPGATGFIQTSNLTIHLAAAQLRTLNNPTTIATYWATVVNTLDSTFGYQGFRKRGEVIITERTSRFGGAYADYPIVTGFGWNNEEFLNGVYSITTSKPWGTFHELGHTFQDSFDRAFALHSNGEIDVNIFAAAGYELIYGLNAWDSNSSGFLKGDPRLSERSDFFALPLSGQTWDEAISAAGPQLGYDFYFNLSEAFGWQVYSNSFGRLMRFLQSTNAAVTDPELSALDHNDPNYVRNRFYFLFSEASQRDLTAYFLTHGLGRDNYPLTASVTNLIHSRGYQVWITNRPPTSFVTPGNLALSNSTPVGSVVSVFSATDLDPGNRFIYEIADGNAGGAFTVDRHSGQLRLAAPLNAATQSNYALVVTVFDVAVPRYFLTNTVLVTVTSVVEQPTLAFSFDGASGVPTNLNLNWSSNNIGWRLLTQTNHLANGISTNTNDWSTVTGSAGTNRVVIPINATKPGGYFRLIQP